jgi:hypothetical protein
MTDAIEPDTKDWTWVLTRPCPECGFDTRALGRSDIGPVIRTSATSWVALLADPPAPVRERPVPGVWSPLEYACHVRDVYRLYDERLRLMLSVDDAHFANWDQDAAAVADRYAEQDPATVSAELAVAGDALADAFDSIAAADDASWLRTGTRSDGALFTVETFGRYLVHDPVHHLHDAGVTQR